MRTSFCSCQLCPDSFESLGADAFDVQEQVGVILEDVERPLLVDGNDVSGELRADAANGPRSEVLFDAFR